MTWQVWKSCVTIAIFWNYLFSLNMIFSFYMPVKKSPGFWRCSRRGLVLHKQMQSHNIKSNHFLLSHHHSTCALVCEILESILQTVQKQFTYRQYILTDLNRRQCAGYTYIYSVHTVYYLRHTYNYLYYQNTRYSPYVHILPYVHIYTHNSMRKKGATDYT